MAFTRRNVRAIGTAKLRQFGLNAPENCTLEDLRSMVFLLTIMHTEEEDPLYKSFHLIASFLICSEIESISSDHRFFTSPPERRVLSLDAPFLQQDWQSMFRFRKENITVLLQVLQIPPEFQLDNGGHVNGMEALLITLRMLAYPTRLLDIETLCGIERSRVSRIFNYVMDLIYRKFGKQFKNQFSFFVQFLDQSKTAIQNKKKKLYLQHYHQERRTFDNNICGYYDGFRIEVCRPSASHVTDDDVIHANIQSLVYSGYTKVNYYLCCVSFD